MPPVAPPNEVYCARWGAGQSFMVSAYEHAHRARSKQDSVLALMEQAQALCEDDRKFASSYMDALVWLRRPYDA